MIIMIIMIMMIIIIIIMIRMQIRFHWRVPTSPSCTLSNN